MSQANLASGLFPGRIRGEMGVCCELVQNKELQSRIGVVPLGC